MFKSSIPITETIKKQTKTGFVETFLNRVMSKFKTTNLTVLRLEGIISSGSSTLKHHLSLEKLNKTIEASFKVKNLQAVLLIINSPGGSPVQSELIASRIIALSKEKQIPVYTFVEDVAASGGYWLACAGDKIFASKNSIVGSIGVIKTGFGFTKAIDKIGVERRIFTQGENKSVLDPFVPVKEHDIELIGNIQSNIHKNFINFVTSRRVKKLNNTQKNLFQGDFWTGEEALELGLIDGIGDMFSFIKKEFPEAKIKYIQEKKPWFRKTFSIFSSEQFLLNSLIHAENEGLNSKFKFF